MAYISAKSINLSEQALKSGDKYYREKKYSEALKNYEMAVDLNPNNIKAIEYVGCLYGFESGVKNIDKAIEYFEKGKQLNDPISIFSLGFIYRKEKEDADKAIEYYQMAAELNYPVALNNLGVIYCGEERKDINKQ